MAKRLERLSIGKTFVSGGEVVPVEEPERFVLDKSRRYYVFDIIPVGKVRTTQSDKWWKSNVKSDDEKRRKRAEQIKEYYDTCELLRWQAKELGFELGNTLEAIFFIPMPPSWSEKKKKKLNGMPCQNKPDLDNILKWCWDSLAKSDQHIWKTYCEKRWAYAGSIIVYQ